MRISVSLSEVSVRSQCEYQCESVRSQCQGMCQQSVLEECLRSVSEVEVCVRSMCQKCVSEIGFSSMCQRYGSQVDICVRNMCQQYVSDYV